MKRILYASFFAAFAACSLSSCMNGDYDADPTNVSTGGNPLNPGGNNGGGGGNNTSFNWEGTDPVSAKVDGAGWQATGATFIPAMSSFPGTITATSGDGSAIVVNIPNNPTLNTTYSFGSNLTGTYSTAENTQNPNDIYGAGLPGGSGQVMILENDDTHIKGKFYFTGKNIAGGSRNVSEGYFNVQK